MRIILITDGIYPYRPSAGGAWCHRLIRGLPEHTFHLVAVADRLPTAPAYDPPAHARGLTAIATDSAVPHAHRGRAWRQAVLARRRVATHSAVLLCRGMLAATPYGATTFRAGLHRLAGTDTDGSGPLGGVPLTTVLLDAWLATYEAPGAAMPSGPAAGAPLAALPPPSLGDAAEAASFLEAAVRPLAAPVPAGDLSHATDTGLSALVALGALWRTGTPYVLSEHRGYLGSSLLDRITRPGARAIALRFLRSLAVLAYAEAAAIVPLIEPLRRWELHHGARPDRVNLVPHAVDPATCPPLRGEPIERTITWLGPPQGLPAMLSALALLRAWHPDARLIVAGPYPGVAYSEPVSFLGPVSHRRSAYATGQIAVVDGDDPMMPYSLIEAMMCGRPVVLLDGGPLAMVAGPGAVVVPHGNARALAAACRDLLDSAERRKELGTAASRHARTRYALPRVLDRFRDIYDLAVLDAPAEAPEDRPDLTVAAVR